MPLTKQIMLNYTIILKITEVPLFGSAPTPLFRCFRGLWLFLPWLSPGIVRLLSVLVVFTFFILILCGAVVGIQWLSCFHFLRLNVAIMLHLRLYMNRAEGEVCINEKITQPKSFYWDHNKLAQ